MVLVLFSLLCPHCHSKTVWVVRSTVWPFEGIDRDRLATDGPQIDEKPRVMAIFVDPRGLLNQFLALPLCHQHLFHAIWLILRLKIRFMILNPVFYRELLRRTDTLVESTYLGTHEPDAAGTHPPKDT